MRSSWDVLMVTPSILFKKEEYRELSQNEKWERILGDGWRYDLHKDKFYKLTPRESK